MIEQSLIFGPERHLVGTVTLPEQPVVGQVMLLLTNAGVIPRVGPHRVNVKLARHFAQQFQKLLSNVWWWWRRCAGQSV